MSVSPPVRLYLLHCNVGNVALGQCIVYCRRSKTLHQCEYLQQLSSVLIGNRFPVIDTPISHNRGLSRLGEWRMVPAPISTWFKICRRPLSLPHNISSNWSCDHKYESFPISHLLHLLLPSPIVLPSPYSTASKLPRWQNKPGLGRTYSTSWRTKWPLRC